MACASLRLPGMLAPDNNSLHPGIPLARRIPSITLGMLVPQVSAGGKPPSTNEPPITTTNFTPCFSSSAGSAKGPAWTSSGRNSECDVTSIEKTNNITRATPTNAVAILRLLLKTRVSRPMTNSSNTQPMGYTNTLMIFLTRKSISSIHHSPELVFRPT